MLRNKKSIMVFIGLLLISLLSAQDGGDDIYILDGNLGIGIDNPEKTLEVKDEMTVSDKSVPAEPADVLLTPYKLEYIWGLDPKSRLGFYRENSTLTFKYYRDFNSTEPINPISFSPDGLSIGGLLSTDIKFQVFGTAQIEKLGIGTDITPWSVEPFSWNFVVAGHMGVVGNLDVQGRTHAYTSTVGKMGVKYGIDEALPTDYDFAVKGKILTQEVKVLASNNAVWTWPDYVFEEDHNLMDINTLAEFIKANKHLPEIPTAKEVAENGLELGEFQAKILKKVEELTLYMIELKQENEILKEGNEYLRKEMNSLRNQSLGTK
ncbi:MAG: hypothetical protein K8S23_06370 [Candidatus Cloacimonetes bacterium]|nr:hypothetical protein [Candidatus Cloacimonadota bacterium]